MAVEGKGFHRQGWQVEDIRWRVVWLAYFIGFLITLAVGLPLLIAVENSWLLALAGLSGLLTGGFVVGRKMGRQLAIINSALMSILYNFTVALVFFVGWFLQLLPEPLPGLPQGDSTFFFAWPLAQFVVSVLAAIWGSHSAVKVAKSEA